MKDVLWFMNFDSWPFKRAEGEKRIDFTVKMCIMTVLWASAVALDWWAILIVYGAYLGLGRIKK